MFYRHLELLSRGKAELDAAIQRGKLVQANVAEIEAKRQNPLRYLFR